MNEANSWRKSLNYWIPSQDSHILRVQLTQGIPVITRNPLWGKYLQCGRPTWLTQIVDVFGIVNCIWQSNAAPWLTFSTCDTISHCTLKRGVNCKKNPESFRSGFLHFSETIYWILYNQLTFQSDRIRYCTAPWKRTRKTWLKFSMIRYT